MRWVKTDDRSRCRFSAVRGVLLRARGRPAPRFSGSGSASRTYYLELGPKQRTNPMHTFQSSLVALVFLAVVGLAFSDKPMTPSSTAGNRLSARFPTIPVEHRHVHELAENAMLYVAP